MRTSAGTAFAADSQWMLPFTLRASAPGVPLRVCGSYVQWTAVTVPAALKRQDGTGYAWQGGVGRERNIVAFSAICAHKLAYPTREVSFIRYQREKSSTSGAVRIASSSRKNGSTTRSA